MAGKKKKGLYRTSYEGKVQPRLSEIEGWARNGLTLDQIAHNLGIAPSTLKKYKTIHEDLADSLARGKEVVDLEVENALLKKATGYFWTETQIEYKILDAPDPETGEPVKVPVKRRDTRRHVEGDVTALMFWLANRKRADWQYKPVPDTDGEEEDETGVVVLAPVDAEPAPPPELVAEMATQGAQRERVAGEVS